VLSSTSSSDERLPRGSWSRTWALALTLAAAVLGLYEGYWRLRGVSASLGDDNQVWALARGSIRPNDPEEIVLLGASRIQLGLDLEEMARAFDGRRPVQLARPGSIWVPVLEHLSDDPTFCGVVVCDFYSGMLSDLCGLSPVAQAEAVQFYNNRGAGALLEYRLRSLCDQHLVCRRLELNLPNLLDHFRQGQLPHPQTARKMLPNRSARFDFQQVELAAQPQYVPTGVPKNHLARVRDNLARWRKMAKRIRARGGRLVFVMMPVSGRNRAFEDDVFPRATEWDLLAKEPWAITVHYSDYPVLAYYQCPDGCHLDYRDAGPFTRAFATILKAKLSAVR
jgi:hypothetical protein